MGIPMIDGVTLESLNAVIERLEPEWRGMQLAPDEHAGARSRPQAVLTPKRIRQRILRECDYDAHMAEVVERYLRIDGRTLTELQSWLVALCPC
jgi:hypothetical protein